MAQKASQISLSVVQKDILSEALNLVYHGSKSQSKKLIRLGDNLIEHLLIDPRITEAYQEFVQSFVPDEDFSIQEALDQLDFIEGRFYSTTGTAGAEVMFVRRHRAQKADELINRKAGANLLENRYGSGLLWSFRLFWYLFPPATVSREYVPNGEPIVQDDYAQYANTWVPPTIKPVAENQPTKRPDLWQQYLDRLMPKQHLCWWTDGEGKRLEVPQQDFFEAWLAQRVCYPIVPNNISVVLRGNFGTGKGFWLDAIAKELVGMANYQPVTTKAWKGDFNGDLFDSVIIHLEETNDTRANTADMLKMLVTQDRHRANVKNLPQKFVQKHFAIAISSNHFDPIKIDEHDRRYFVPVWSDHLTGSNGKSETAAFFEEFNDWLNRGGFQEMRDWFEQVDVMSYNFRVAPDTDAKYEICIKDDPSESRQSQLALWLIERKDRKVAYTSGELMKANPFMTTVQIQAALRQAGYVWIERSFKNKKHNLWVPSKHKNAQFLDRNNWTLFQHFGSDAIELQEDQEPLKSNLFESEVHIKVQMDAGKTVVINEYRHPNLKELSLQNGTLVNIMRPPSGGTIYGNETDRDRDDKSDEERDRVCDEFETRQLPYFTDEEIRHLKGKVLMCRCKPKRCHGDSLAKAANDFVD
jgi:hypothetical protein